jgi:hypothetical protein
VTDTPAARRIAGVVALVALAALTVASLWTVLPPSPAGPDAPPDQFSAARAYTHVQRIGENVHVAGSAAADDVRAYIMETLRSYGLQPQIQDAVGADSALGHGYAMAHVRNVVAVLHGSAPSVPVVAMAHYDSVQVSHGANDDGAGVTSLLETARAMAQGPRPRNDVVFLFTEAEEACLCGAEAFVHDDPLALHGGVVLNMESRGSTGPAIMFETSFDNADVVGVYASAVPYPVATSFAVEVYRILPNDTDFTPFRESGQYRGLNTAYIDGSAVYHSPEDQASYLDKSSLQQEGADTLALVRAFGNIDQSTLDNAGSGDVTYFPVLGLLLIYPGWLVWPLAGLAVLAVAALVLVARRRHASRVGRAAAGFGLAFIPLLLAPVVAQLFWALLVAVRPGYANMIDPWRPAWFRGAVLALVAAVVFTWYGLLRRRIGAWPLAIGAIGWLGLLGVVLAWATPGGSYLAALPALAAGLAAIVAVTLNPSWAWARTLALALGGVVSVLVLAPTVLLFFPALGLATGAAAALFTALLALALLPLLESLYPSASSTMDLPAAQRRLAGALPGIVAGVVALACAGTGLAVDHFDATHPAPAQLMYAMDTDTDQAMWVSADGSPGAWTRQFVHDRTDLSTLFPPLGTAKLWTGPATAASLPAPTVTVMSDTTAGGNRTLELTIRPQRAVRLVYLRVDGATVRGAEVDGRAVDREAFASGFNVLFHAPPPDGLPVTLRLDATGQVRLRVMDGSDGLDALPGFIPRPAGVGIAGSHDTELVLVAKTYTL